jgi:hypothetical protein
MGKVRAAQHFREGIVTDNQRASIIDRARKLAAMTIANGCSEAEATLAATKLAQLIAAHDLTQDELAIRRETAACEFGELVLMEDSFNDIMDVQSAIGLLFTTKPFFRRVREDYLGIGSMQDLTKVKFFGTPTDVAASIAMMEICTTAINTEAVAWTRANAASRKRDYKHALQSFRVGMAMRLAERVKELIQPSTGRGLIVLKGQLVMDEWAKQNIKLRAARHTVPADARAWGAGQSAANNVRLGHHAEVSNG